MHSKLCAKVLMALLLLFARMDARAQALPSAETHRWPFAVGAGISGIDADADPPTYRGAMGGISLWGEWYPARLPATLHGLGLTTTLHDGFFSRSATLSSNFKQVTAGGGLIYQYPRWRSFRPYGKLMAEYASIDFHFPNNSAYTHDSRNILAYAAGADTRLRKHLWLRADYEYQSWPMLFGTNHHPQIFSLGVMYRFSDPQPKHAGYMR